LISLISEEGQQEALLLYQSLYSIPNSGYIPMLDDYELERTSAQ